MTAALDLQKPPEPLKNPIQPLICGVDPGLTGAIAFLNASTGLLSHVIDIPVTTPPKSEIVISELLEALKPYAPQTRLAVIELVGAMPGQGLTSTFRFGLTTGILHGTIGALGIEIAQVRPQIWKAQLGLSREKKLSIELAKRLFPDHAEKFTSKHDGRAEAALIAYFGSKLKRLG